MRQAEANLDASGRWTRGTDSRTALKIKLESPDAGQLLNALGFKDAMRRGEAELTGDISWPGAPFEMVPAKLSGELNLTASSGEFLKLEPGAGRLLGLMSLQSLPRRLTFDFRDLFSDGFAFYKLGGTLHVRDGILHTEDFNINGASARVGMADRDRDPDAE